MDRRVENGGFGSGFGDERMEVSRGGGAELRGFWDVDELALWEHGGAKLVLGDRLGRKATNYLGWVLGVIWGREKLLGLAIIVLDHAVAKYFDRIGCAGLEKKAWAKNCKGASDGTKC